jgi:hypothetical protein
MSKPRTKVKVSPEVALARHAASLSLISGPIGLRPDIDVADGAASRRRAGSDDRVRRRGPDRTRGHEDHPAEWRRLEAAIREKVTRNLPYVGLPSLQGRDGVTRT